MLLLHRNVMANCDVKGSPHEAMGDPHDEPKGSAADGAVEDGARGEGDQRARGGRPARQSPTRSAAEGTVAGRGGAGPAAPRARAAVAAPLGLDDHGADRHPAAHPLQAVSYTHLTLPTSD